jgi:hypothetical protein
LLPGVAVHVVRDFQDVEGGEVMSDCRLPSECDCEQCKWWGENGFDLSRTPDWQKPKQDAEDEGE